MEIYTLQRFYHEVKALIESSEKLTKELEKKEQVLEVEFMMKENKESVPMLHCSLISRKFDGLGSGSVIFIYEKSSPQDVLIELKELINELEGNHIKNRVGVEIE